MPRLLVLPGWDDDGKPQYDALRATLQVKGWACRRADLPDARWPAARRDAVTRGENLQQACADFDALAGRDQPGAIGALGFSYGGYIAALLSALRPLEWLVLRSPALYPDDQWDTPKADLDKGTLDAYRHQPHGPAHNRALAACAAFRGDVLLIQSERDEVIPAQVIDSYAEAFAEARSLQRFCLPEADHPLSREEWRLEYHRRVVEWLHARWGEISAR